MNWKQHCEYQAVETLRQCLCGTLRLLLEMNQDALSWRRHEQRGISAVNQEEADSAVSCSDREMNLQRRDQIMEDEPGS